MNPNIDFRTDEVSKLFSWIRAGESAAIIGVSGIGKSHLIRIIQDQRTRKSQLKDSFAHYVFVRVNFLYLPDFSDRSVYSFILEQLEFIGDEAKMLNLEQDTISFIGEQHRKLLDSGNDSLKVQRYFRLAIRSLFDKPNRRLIVLFDQFDEPFKSAKTRLFVNLRGLRETYKYRISFLICMSNILYGDKGSSPAQETFYELFARNTIGLGPYNRQLSRQLLRHTADRNMLRFSDEMGDQIFSLTGGHAGLLRSCFITMSNNEVEPHHRMEETVQALLLVPDVEIQCNRIWSSLDVNEQRVLVLISNGMSINERERWPEQRLRLKGILDDSAGIFSPLFAGFVAEQSSVINRPIYLDSQSRRVWTNGRLVTPLTALEFRLFQLLYNRLDKVVSKDELVEAGWPESMGGVSDEALATAIYRLRKKLETDGTVVIKNIREQGYSLQTI